MTVADYVNQLRLLLPFHASTLFDKLRVTIGVARIVAMMLKFAPDKMLYALSLLFTFSIIKPSVRAYLFHSLSLRVERPSE
jgi:hypothetical protein